MFSPTPPTLGTRSPGATDLRSWNPTLPFTGTWTSPILTIGKAILATRFLGYPHHHPYVATALLFTASCLNEPAGNSSSNIRIIAKTVLALFVTSLFASSRTPFIGTAFSLAILTSFHRHFPISSFMNTAIEIGAASLDANAYPSHVSHNTHIYVHGNPYLHPHGSFATQHSVAPPSGARAPVGGCGKLPGQPPTPPSSFDGRGPFGGTPWSRDSTPPKLPGQPYGATESRGKAVHGSREDSPRFSETGYPPLPGMPLPSAPSYRS